MAVPCRNALLVTLLLSTATAAPLAAQPETRDSSRVSLRYDSSDIALRIPPSAALESYRTDDAFDYSRQLREPESLWDRLNRWIQTKLAELFGSDELAPLWRAMPYIVIGIALGVLVMRLMGADARSLLRGRPAKAPAGDLGADEDIHTMDFESLIARAVAEGNFRAAVRIQYLRLLRSLADRGMISWRREKTNHDYVSELAATPHQQSFLRATLLFEYFWYGGFPLDRDVYDRVAERIRGAA